VTKSRAGRRDLVADVREYLQGMSSLDEGFEGRGNTRRGEQEEGRGEGKKSSGGVTWAVG